MKQLLIWLLLAAVLLFSGLLPLQSTDVSRLRPAEAIVIWREGDRICVRCGEKLRGSGGTLSQALENMELGAGEELFLDTAGYVLLRQTDSALLAQTVQNKKLRPAAELVFFTGDIPPAEAAAAYLRTHSGEMTLGLVRASLLGDGSVTIPRLRVVGERMERLDG